MNSSRIIVIGGLPESLINFRGDLLLALRSKFDSLTAMSAPAPGYVVEKLGEMDVKHYALPIQRNGLNPLSDIRLLCRLIRLFRDLNPGVVFAYTIKPVIWGGLSSRITGAPFVALITGLGYAFQGKTGLRALLKKTIVCLYKQALLKAQCVVFQNPDNAELFVSLGIVSSDKVRIVNGSGVNIRRFPACPLPVFESEKLSFLCVARLLKEKGLIEYAEAASIVRLRYPEASFGLLGPIDPSPDAISIEQVRSWNHIDYLGEADDVRPFIENCHVYVLPSYHEGLPRSTLEAMSMARPVLTTDAVGCRETVVEGVNGFKVPVGNAQQLANRMMWCIENQDRLESMGNSSRSLVEEKFDVDIVNRHIMEALGLDV